jgi:DNA (cytosine-5)-methyltransferase 1
LKTNIEFVQSKRGIALELKCSNALDQWDLNSWVSPGGHKQGARIIDEWDRQILLGKKSLVEHSHQVKKVKVVDLFCGAGGFTEGLKQGFQTLGISCEVIAACDIDRKALEIYTLNHDPQTALAHDLNAYIDFSLRRKSEHDIALSSVKFAGNDLKAIEILLNGCDVLIAGPPCQGHSNLNNHSRRNDPRNNLYISVAAYAALLQPRMIAIENVQTVVHDKGSVVERTKNLLRNLGYSTEEVTINGVSIGMPQTRKRHFLIAKQGSQIDMKSTIDEYKKHFPNPRPVSWCLEIAPKIFDCENEFYLPSSLSDENQARIDWLLDNDEYDLPNHLRPLCHQKDHNYKSIYGRMKWDLPSGTITTGFHSPGRGRYVHPHEKRVITACEASLIQGFPLTYKFFSDMFSPGRNLLSKVIGDAVSPQMARIIGQNFGLEMIIETSGPAIAAA